MPSRGSFAGDSDRHRDEAVGSRTLTGRAKVELDQLAARLEEADALIEQTAREKKACRRLDAIPGIGPVTATALLAAIGNGAAFRKAREFADWWA